MSRQKTGGIAMARKGENIYLRKDGRWEGRYIKGRRADGKAVFGSIYGKQYCEVKRQLIIIKSKQYRETAQSPQQDARTFYDWGEHWLEKIIRPHIKTGTYSGYRRNLEKHIYPFLMDIMITEITSEDIQAMVNTLRPTMAPTTLHGVCRLLKSILNSAYEKGIITQNPFQNIWLPKINRKTPRVLTYQEQEKLEQQVIKTGELEYLLCLYTGLRVGELCALRWRDIDLENAVLHVRHSVQRIPVSVEKKKTLLIMGSPKSESSLRDIPIPSFISKVFEQKKNEEGVFENDFVFRGRKNGYRDPRTMQQRITSICSGMEIEGVHMHTLRHTFATRCLEKDIGYEVLCEFLGHSSPKVTLSHYAHCTLETKRENIERLIPAAKAAKK